MPPGIGYPSTATTPAKFANDEEEMMRAATRILANGGTKQDVADYFYKGYGVALNGYTPEPETPGKVRGYAMNAMQGLTFGFGDEAMGAILGLLTGEGASAGIDEYRAELQKFNAANPVSATAAEMGGSLLLAPVMAPAAAAMKGMGLAGRAGVGAGVGAGAGGLYGAGNAQGGLSERAKGAVVGGALGAGVGAAAPVVGAAAGTVVKPISRQLATWSERFRNVPKNATTASKAGREYWAEAITRDHGSIDAAIQKAERLARTGAPVTLADVAGENGLSLVQAAAGLRGPGKQKLVEDLLTRQADQGDRMMSKLFRSLKLGAENAYDAADDLMANRRSASAPLYESAYQAETKVTPELKKILDNPRFQKAYEMGRLIAQDEDTFGTANAGALKIGPLAMDANNRVVAETIPVRALDYMKRGMDALINQAAQRGEAMDPQLGRALRKGLNDALDAIQDVPDYRRARSVWRGESEALEALNMGKGGVPLNAGGVRTTRFMQKPPEVIKRELKELTPAEQEMYKLGVAQDVAEFLAETTADAPNAAKKFGGRLYGEAMSNVEKRVRAIFTSDEAAQEFMDYVKAEARISRTTGVLGGSRTAPMQQMMSELTGSQPQSGSVVRRVADATITAMTDRAKTGWTDAISDEISAQALKGSRGADELIAFLNSLRPHAPRRRVAPTVVAAQQAAQVR